MTFASFAEFVTTHRPRGLGTSIERLEDLCHRDIKLLDMIKEAVRRPPHVHSDLSIRKVTYPVGTTRARALRHLRDHRPDLHNRVIAGELSPNAAMICAGFRRRTFTVPDDIEGAAGGTALVPTRQNC